MGLSSVHGASIIYEPFDTQDTYSPGWTYSDTGACNNGETPLSLYGTWAFGVNYTSSSPSTCSYSRRIYQDLPNGIQDDGEIQINYDYVQLNQTKNGGSILNMKLLLYNLSYAGYISVEHDNGSVKVEDEGGSFSFNGFDDCIVTDNNLTAPYHYSFSLYINLDTNKYSLIYYNDTFQKIACFNKNAGNFGVENIYIEQLIPNGMSSMESYIDNIHVMYTESSTFNVSHGAGTFDNGWPCETDADCISGKCEFNGCVLKTYKEDCTSNVQCTSGLCVGGKCTKPSLMQGVEATKNEQFGDDIDTNNFISLFFIILIPLIMITAGGGHKGAFYSGVGVFFALSFFFTIIGWLSVFILLANILTALIIVVFSFMVGGSSN